MSIRTWSSDYISGFPSIDEQHEKFFEMINAFAEKNDEKVSINALITFLNNLSDYSEKHFAQEEKLMEENNYPLLDYHINLHKDLRRRIRIMKGQIKNSSLEDPYTTVISFVADWLNGHIARDDLTFISFCKNINCDLDKSVVSRKCEISTMGNEILGIGKIQSIYMNTVIVANTTDKRMPVKLNDMVKVSVFSAGSKLRVFVAVVFYSTSEILKLFNVTLIKAINYRKYFRVSTNLEAKLWLEEESFPITIDDISAGGLHVEAEQPLEPYKMVMIEFVAQNNRFMEPCKIVHATKRIGAPNSYGLKFAGMDSSRFDKLNTYIFNRYVLQRSSEYR